LKLVIGEFETVVRAQSGCDTLEGLARNVLHFAAVTANRVVVVGAVAKDVRRVPALVDPRAGLVLARKQVQGSIDGR